MQNFIKGGISIQHVTANVTLLHLRSKALSMIHVHSITSDYCGTTSQWNVMQLLIGMWNFHWNVVITHWHVVTGLSLLNTILIYQQNATLATSTPTYIRLMSCINNIMGDSDDGLLLPYRTHIKFRGFHGMHLIHENSTKLLRNSHSSSCMHEI